MQYATPFQRITAYPGAYGGIGLKLSVDYCSNFNRFSLLRQALVQDLRACPSFP